MLGLHPGLFLPHRIENLRKNDRFEKIVTEDTEPRHGDHRADKVSGSVNSVSELCALSVTGMIFTQFSEGLLKPNHCDLFRFPSSGLR